MSTLEDDLRAHASERPLEADVPRAWGAYRGHRELLDHLARLEDEGARIEVRGRSRRGEALVRIELGPKERAPSALVLAGLHAMEWIGVESALALVEALLRDPPREAVVVYPLLNPDGYRVVEANLRRRRRGFARTNAAGVDLNRNWPTFFRPTRTLAQRVLPFLGGPGAAPGSEPEVRVVLDELEAHRGSLGRAVSLHSFGGMLLIPYGGRFARPEDDAALRAHAHAMNERLGGRYRVRNSARWVPGMFAYGMELDHLHASGITPILIECGFGQASIARPSTWLHPFRWFNPSDPSDEAGRIASAVRPFLLDEPG